MNPTTKTAKPKTSEPATPNKAQGSTAQVKPEEAAKNPPPLTEERVRKIVEESISKTMKELAKSVEEAIKKNVEAAVGKSGKSIEESVVKSVDGKLKNQTDRIQNVQKVMKGLSDTLQTHCSKFNSDGEYAKRIADVKSTVDDVNEKLDKLEDVSGNGPDDAADDVDIEGAANAAASLARMSEAITAMSDSVVNIATEGKGTAERLEAAAGKVQQSIGKIEECKDNAAEVCARIEEKLQQAEEDLTKRQNALAELVVQMNDLLSIPQTFQNEVVGRMEMILEAISKSVKSLDDQLKDVKDKLALIGDLSEFREKAMLSVSFAEAAKSLQEAFDESMERASKGPK